VAKARFSADDWFDVWLPILAPSPELVASAQAASNDADWRRFAARYASEMNRPDPSRVLDLLAALSHQASFSVGCYCEDERRCHRSLLGKLLEERGAKLKTR
jgi:uncharacterized protein YeaO (DUF488 family)